MVSRLCHVFTAIVSVFAILYATDHARAEVAVAAGHSVSLMTLSSIDQGCHSLGPVAVSVITPPQGGFIEVMQVRAYPNFNALNTRSRCNTIKLPATQVIYQSSGNFLGLDYVTVEVIFPEGGVKRLRVPISVRPVGPAAVDNPAVSGLATPVVPDDPMRPARHAKHAAAAPAHRHHRCVSSCGEPGAVARHAPPHQTPPKSPLVNI